MNANEVAQRLLQIEAKVASEWSPPPGATAPEAIRDTRDTFRRHEGDEEHRLTIADPRTQRLFVTLCCRYGLDVFRRERQRQATVMVRAPRLFITRVLMPLLDEMDVVLGAFVDAQVGAALVTLTEEVTSRVTPR